MEPGVYRIIVAPEVMDFFSSMRSGGSNSWIVQLIVARRLGENIHELNIAIQLMEREDGSGRSFNFHYQHVQGGGGGRGYINFATNDGEDRGWIEVSN